MIIVYFKYEQFMLSLYCVHYIKDKFSLHRKIWNHYQNMKSFFLPDKSSEAETIVRKFFKQQDIWQRLMIQKHQDDPYWRHVSYIVAHLDGLYEGYSEVAKNHTDWVRFHWFFFAIES